MRSSPCRSGPPRRGPCRLAWRSRWARTSTTCWSKGRRVPARACWLVLADALGRSGAASATASPTSWCSAARRAPRSRRHVLHASVLHARHPVVARRPRHHRCRYRRRAYGARPRSGRLRRSGQKYGLLEKYTAAEVNPVDGNGVYLPGDAELFAGQFIWKANDSIIDLAAPSAALLLAFGKARRTATRIAGGTSRRWRSAPRRNGSFPWSRQTCAATRWQSIKGVTWIPDWGEARIAGMIDGRPGLVHQPPAHLGRADRVVRAQDQRRAASAQRRADADRRRPGAAGRHRCLVRARCRRTCSATRLATTTRSPTSSTSGSIPASPTKACLPHARSKACTSRRTCTWKGPTSIAAGSRARC